MSESINTNPSPFVRNPLLFTVVLPVSFFFILAVYSPLIVYDNLADWYGSWQQSMFSFVCHQQLDRTYILNGVPLAVCNRCTGIYSGLFAGLLLFSFFSDYVIKSEHYIPRFFFALSFIILLDGSANLLNFWQSATEIRLLTGAGWGLSTGTVLVWALIIPRIQKIRSTV